MFREVTKLGLEGIIAKKSSSTYAAGRSPNWLKIKAARTGDFVIVGYTQPKGTRSFIGALQLAEFVEGRLCYVGRVGTGMDDAMLLELIGLISPDIRRDAPCHGMAVTPGADPLPSESIPETSTTTWVEPHYVCEVQYADITPDGLLRHSSFLRLRNDKRPDECERRWNDDRGQTPRAQPEGSDLLAQHQRPAASTQRSAATAPQQRCRMRRWRRDL